MFDEYYMSFLHQSWPLIITPSLYFVLSYIIYSYVYFSHIGVLPLYSLYCIIQLFLFHKMRETSIFVGFRPTPFWIIGAAEGGAGGAGCPKKFKSVKGGRGCRKKLNAANGGAGCQKKLKDAEDNAGCREKLNEAEGT